jgi:hypothetical protein
VYGVRASDSDREHTLAALREHTAAGRLSLDEFGERASRVYAARTLTELASTTADLPAAEQHHDPRQLAMILAIALAVVAVLGVLYWLLT